MLERTRTALEAYDADQSRLYKLMMDAMTNEEVFAAEAEGERAADKVREAFALDTADVNSRERAFLVGPNDPWLREQVRKHATQQAPG